MSIRESHDGPSPLPGKVVDSCFKGVGEKGISGTRFLPPSCGHPLFLDHLGREFRKTTTEKLEGIRRGDCSEHIGQTVVDFHIHFDRHRHGCVEHCAEQEARYSGNLLVIALRFCLNHRDRCMQRAKLHVLQHPSYTEFQPQVHFTQHRCND